MCGLVADDIVADVEPLEGYFQAHEMLESTLEAKPISITRNEIYGTLSILMRQIPVLVSCPSPSVVRGTKADSRSDQ